MSQTTDQPGAPREGEALPTEALALYLGQHLPGTGGGLTVRQFAGGYSNLTYLLIWGGREYVLRRPPVGANIKSAHDMGREYRILQLLRPVYGRVPTPVLYCEDGAVLGAPFYLMSRVEGRILRPSLAADEAPAPDVMVGIADAFVRTLAELHALDTAATGLEALGRPEGYVARQVAGWAKRYQAARTDDLPELEYAATWLAEHQPPDTGGAALLHNDFKYDNLVLHPDDLTQVQAVLDWEMATVGDPLMDLGTTLGYWVNADDPDFMLQMRLSPTHLPGNPTREGLLHLYAQHTGREVGDGVFHYVFGLFKVAVIGQQIYARYRKGLTQDPRFGRLIHAVRGCGLMARQAILKKRLDGLA